MATIKKSEQAKQALISFIHDRKMKPGDRLPSQDVLRRQFNVGTATIAHAIRELRDEGILDVQDKVGIFVLDPKVEGFAGRMIGITARYVEESPYYCCLLCALEQKLLHESCQSRVFAYKSGVSEHKSAFSLDDFPGLRRSVRDGELDGILHLDDFIPESVREIRETGLPLFMVGNESASVNGLFFDEKQMLTDCCRKLSRIGAKHPALVIQTVLSGYFSDFWKELTDSRGRIFTTQFSGDYNHVVQEIAALPDDERPDWIVYLDDIAAQGITAGLAMMLRGQPLPSAIVLRNRQLLLQFAAPEVVVFDIDLHDFAAQAVELLLKTIRSGQLDAGHNRYHISETVQQHSL